MNWTGGALPRSRNSNARATLTATQKKHFAKVRGKLLNGPGSSPDLDFSIFDHATKIDRPGSKRPHGTSAHETGNNTQRRLEDYKQVAPIVHRLDNIRPRQNPHDSASPRGRQPGGALNSDPLLHIPPATLASVKEVHQRSAGNRYGRLNTPSEPAKLVTAAEDSFEARRQELLQREDWVGLANTKPAKIQFTNLQDRQLIGKRRRVEGAEHGLQPQHTPKRRAIQNHTHAQESSDFGDISVRIGSQAWDGRKVETPPIRQARCSGGTFDDMLFDNEDMRIGSTQNLNRGKSRTYANEVRSQSHFEGTEASGSLQTSWNGFSPQSNSTHQFLFEDDLRANSEKFSIERITAERGSSTGHSERNLKLDAAKTARSPEENPWAGVPGLPLVFEDRSPTPIEISSNISSESPWGPPSMYMDRPGQVHTAKQPRLDLSLQEFKHDRERLPITHSPPFLSREREEYAGSELKHSSIVDGPQQSATAIIEAPLAMSTEKHATEMSEALLAAHGTIEYKEPTSTQESQVRLPSPAKKVMENSLSPVDDEEMIWRNFVFGNDSESVDHEPEKPFRRQIDTKTNDSSFLTELSERSGQSSLSVQASSAPGSRSRSQIGLTSLEADSVLRDAPSSIAVTTSDRTFPSSVAEGSLATIGAKSQHGPHSSLIAHASVSSNLPESGHLASSPSSDELAVTPRQPTFFFKRPSRYVGSQLDIPATVYIGQGSKGKRGRQPKAELSQREKGRTNADAQDAEEDTSSADEIVDW